MCFLCVIVRFRLPRYKTWSSSSYVAARHKNHLEDGAEVGKFNPTPLFRRVKFLLPARSATEVVVTHIPIIFVAGRGAQLAPFLRCVVCSHTPCQVVKVCFQTQGTPEKLPASGKLASFVSSEPSGQASLS